MPAESRGRRRLQHPSTEVNLKRATVSVLLVLICAASAAAAQDKTTGGLKGKVRVESGSPAGVTVAARRGEDEVSHVTTNDKGEFELRGLRPGPYGLTFRKAGLKVGRVEGVEVRAGKVRTVGGNLYMTLDEGSLAIIQGSVFDQEGRSLRGAKVELALVQADGTLKKIDSRVSSIELGRFVFKLTPETARYRLTATAPNKAAASEDVEVDGAAVYRVALSLASK
jgi:hypothetical protein